MDISKRSNLKCFVASLGMYVLDREGAVCLSKEKLTIASERR